MLSEVDETLAELDLPNEDSAAAELARTYARQIDQAAAIRAKADKLVRDALKFHSDDDALYERVSALQGKLSERDCIDRIGKNLAALLDALGATPKSRAALGTKPGHGGRQAPAGVGALHQLRSVT